MKIAPLLAASFAVQIHVATVISVVLLGGDLGASALSRGRIMHAIAGGLRAPAPVRRTSRRPVGTAHVEGGRLDLPPQYQINVRGRENRPRKVRGAPHM